ncbi:hypothetical protein GF325_03660 [Candidatus Bathyarchaeota archaeon]|nr:hypothetical protein [Candidatus Bathyarchaeota archaeon]
MRSRMVTKTPVIVSSTADMASETIKKEMMILREWNEMECSNKHMQVLEAKEHNAFLCTIETPLVEAHELDRYCMEANIMPSVYLFISKHSSSSKKPSLLVHVTGNWGGDAELGGNPLEISKASGTLVHLGFIELVNEYENNDFLNQFSINVEATHHGPTNLNAPVLFVELGSHEPSWKSQVGGYAVANVVNRLVYLLQEHGQDIHALGKERKIRTAIGIGGTHYAATFDKLMRTYPVGFSHIIPKYHATMITHEVVEQAVENTVEKVSWFVLDWKGLNRSQKDAILPLLEGFDIPILRRKELQRELGTIQQ